MTVPSIRTAMLLVLAPLSLALGSAVAASAPAHPVAQERATFAGGCFWCVEATFEPLPGVISVTSGFSGGREKNPTYEQVSAGVTGHAESVDILYDPSKISYERLLDVFWHNIDPTQSGGQFCDHGNQYRSAIFCRNDQQKTFALRSKEAVSRQLKQTVVTQIVPFTGFYPAEEYHQDYYKKNPENYHAYRTGCGRDRRLQAIWGASAGAHH